MPNIKSAIKRMQTAEKARLRNHSQKSAFRTKVKRAEASLGSPEALPELVKGAVSAIDRAAKTGAIHPRAAARRKSRLMKKVQAATGAPIELGTPKKPAPARKAAKPVSEPENE